jgi:hypothetical protein
MTLKGVNNSNQEKAKREILYELWIEDAEVNTDLVIESIREVVSIKENFVFTTTPQLKNKFIEIINSLIDIIPRSNVNELSTYINSI